MSKYQIVISPKAKSDLEEIYNYTVQNWGQNQASLYLDKFEKAFYELIDYPKIGRERPDVKAGYRSLTVESHVIFYGLKDNEILIFGVLHERMDIANRLL